MILYFLISSFIYFMGEAQNFFPYFIPENITGGNINDQMGSLAEQVWEKSFSDRPCVVLWSENGMLENFNPKSQPSIIRISTVPGESCGTSLNPLGAAFEHNCNIYIVQISKPSCFFELWDYARDNIVPRHNPKLFFLPVYPNSIDYGESLLALPITEISANILVAELEISDERQVKLSTNNFAVRVGTPNRTGRIRLDEWSPHLGFKNNVNLYPDKMKDLKRKEVRFASLQYLPHVNLEPFDGDEARIFIEYCERHNCIIKVYDDDGHQWGNFTGYKQGNGMVGRIYKREADVGGGSCTTLIDYYPHIDFSKTYMLSGITLLVPKGVLLNAWRTPFLPFGLVMWIALFCSVVSSSLGFYAVTALTVKYTRFGNNIKKKGVFTSWADSMIRSFGMAVLQQPAYQFVNLPVRYLFTSFEFLYLILTACYSAELASYLTSPQYTKPIDTYEELASSGLTWIADHPLWTFGISASKEPRDIAVVKQFRVFPFPEILKEALTGKYGLAIERIAEGHYSQHAHITEEVVAKYHVMKEMINSSPLTMVFEKGSAYADSLDDHINRLHNGGIYTYWENKMARKLLDYRIQLALKFAKKENDGSYEPKTLTIEHIQGAFFIYAVGICISFGFLAFEMLKYKNSTKLPINFRNIQGKK